MFKPFPQVPSPYDQLAARANVQRSATTTQPLHPMVSIASSLVQAAVPHTPTRPAGSPELLGPLVPELLATSSEASPNRGRPPPRGEYER